MQQYQWKSMSTIGVEPKLYIPSPHENPKTCSPSDNLHKSLLININNQNLLNRGALDIDRMIKPQVFNERILIVRSTWRLGMFNLEQPTHVITPIDNDDYHSPRQPNGHSDVQSQLKWFVWYLYCWDCFHLKWEEVMPIFSAGTVVIIKQHDFKGFLTERQTNENTPVLKGQKSPECQWLQVMEM